MFDLDAYKAWAASLWADVAAWLSSPQFYAQVIAILACVFLARLLAGLAVARLPFLRDAPVRGKMLVARQWAFTCRDLLRPVLSVLLLGAVAAICDAALGSSWLVRMAQSLALISLLYSVINRFLKHPLINAAARWIALPAAALYVFGLMPHVITFLDQAAFQAGNIRISLLALAKAILFGGFLLWAGRVASTSGQRVIRKQDAIDMQTRELAAKAFDLAVIAIAVLLLLNLLGIDLSLLAVLGGAVGVGLGFGLQQIASNFISGIIILLERSLKLGDYIELEDGKSGTLSALNMRSSHLTTFDGKIINVPNEKFITTRVVNWTHTDPRTRYEVPFTVGFNEDLGKVKDLIEKALPKVKGIIVKPLAPTCELKSLGGYGAEFVAKFWVHGLDEGENSYTSDALFAIWTTLRANKIALAVSPFSSAKAAPMQAKTSETKHAAAESKNEE